MAVSLTVRTSADLAQVPDHVLNDGVQAFMESAGPLFIWQLVRSATDDANGVTVVNTLSGNGRWIRVSCSTQVYSTSGPAGPAGATGPTGAGASFPTGPGDYSLLESGPTGPDWNHTLRGLAGVSYASEVSLGLRTSLTFVDWKVGNKQSITLGGNFLIAFQSPNGPCNLVLKVVQDGTGNRTPTWSAATFGAGATSKIALAGAANSVTLLGIYFDGIYFWVTSSGVMGNGIQATTQLV